jgi:2'-5' RNA ligase
VAVSNTGFYPNARAPRVFWCGVDAPGLDALAAATDGAAAVVGVARESCVYSPHLTLARIKNQPDLQPLQQAIAAATPVDCGRFEAHAFFLYRSQFRPTGSVYTKLAEFPFSKR